MNSLKLIFGITFLDLLAYSMVIPFLPLLFLDCPNCDFLAAVPHKMRYVILGLLYAIYPIAQMLSAPIWGRYSDRFGRKNVLICSYFGNACGYLFCVFGIMYSSLIPFFFGNLVAGLTGANFSTVNALIADRTHKDVRKKYFGIFYMLLGLAFALGPFLCSELLLIIPNLETLCLYLFMGCSAASLFNVCIVKVFLPKTVVAKREQAFKFNFDIRHLLAYSKEVKWVLLSIFLLTFGWYAFVKTFQIYLIEKVELHAQAVLHVVSFYGFCLFISQFLYVFFLHKLVKSQQIIAALAFFLGGSILATLFTNTLVFVFVLVVFFSFAYSMLTPSLTGFYSGLALEKNGEMMGYHQSSVACAKMTAPLLVSVALMIDPSVPIVLSVVAILFCGIVFLQAKKSTYEVETKFQD